MVKKSGTFNKVLFSFLIGAVGLILLSVVYVAATRSTEQRSKAAEEQIFYKRWEFNGKDAEGWNTVGNAAALTVANGVLHYTTEANRTSSIRNTVHLNLPVGNKYIKVRMSVSAPPGVISPGRYDNPWTQAGDGAAMTVPSCRPRPSCLDERPACKIAMPAEGWCLTKPQPVQFMLSVTYTPNGKMPQQPQVWNAGGGAAVYMPIEGFMGAATGTGIADGQMHEYTLRIPSVAPITLDSMTLMQSFAPFYRITHGSADIQIDYIYVAGTKLVGPTCMPRPACLNANPPCKIAQPAKQQWCDITPTPVWMRPSCIPGPPCLYTSPSSCPELPAGNYCSTDTLPTPPQPSVAPIPGQSGGYTGTVQQMTTSSVVEYILSGPLASGGAYRDPRMYPHYQYILIVSPSSDAAPIDLSTYVGKQVQVTGDLGTDDQGHTILTVQTIAPSKQYLF